MKQYELKTTSINTAKLDDPIANKIVIIDPDPACLESVKLFFSQCECVITQLTNTGSALEYIRKNSKQIDLTILDITHSEASALELFKAGPFKITVQHP